MGKELQFKRGLEIEASNAQLLTGEPGYSTDKEKLHIGEAVFLNEQQIIQKITEGQAAFQATIEPLDVFPFQAQAWQGEPLTFTNCKATALKQAEIKGNTQRLSQTGKPCEPSPEAMLVSTLFSINQTVFKDRSENPIVLGKIEESYDQAILKQNQQIEIIRQTQEIVLKGQDEDWEILKTVGLYTLARLAVPDLKYSLTAQALITDRLPVTDNPVEMAQPTQEQFFTEKLAIQELIMQDLTGEEQEAAIEAFAIGADNHYFYCCLLATNATEFKARLASRPITVRYQLKTAKQEEIPAAFNPPFELEAGENTLTIQALVLPSALSFEVFQNYISFNQAAEPLMFTSCPLEASDLTAINALNHQAFLIQAAHTLMPNGQTLSAFLEKILNWETYQASDGLTFALEDLQQAWVKEMRLTGQTLQLEGHLKGTAPVLMINEKLVELPVSALNGWGELADTYEWLADGSQKWTQFCQFKTLTAEDWTLTDLQQTGYKTYAYNCPETLASTSNPVLTNVFEVAEWPKVQKTAQEFIAFESQNATVYLRLQEEKALAEWLQTKQFVIGYQLAAPIITLDQESSKLPTQKGTNLFEIVSEVPAQLFELTVPVHQRQKQLKRLQKLQADLNSLSELATSYF